MTWSVCKTLWGKAPVADVSSGTWVLNLDTGGYIPSNWPQASSFGKQTSQREEHMNKIQLIEKMDELGLGGGPDGCYGYIDLKARMEFVDECMALGAEMHRGELKDLENTRCGAEVPIGKFMDALTADRDDVVNAGFDGLHAVIEEVVTEVKHLSQRLDLQLHRLTKLENTSNA